MEQIEQLSASRKKSFSFLSVDKKSNGYQTLVGFLCIFLVVALLAVMGDPAGAAVQKSQVGKRSNCKKLGRGVGILCVCVCVCVLACFLFCLVFVFFF